LRGLLAYVLETTSFRLLGIWAVVQGIADISDTAWRNHLRNANPWLLWLLGELLAAEVACAPDLALRQRRICLVDATRLRIPGVPSGTQPITLTETAPIAWQDLGGQTVLVTVTYRFQL
jgi:hypothetical protein